MVLWHKNEMVFIQHSVQQSWHWHLQQTWTPQDYAWYVMVDYSLTDVWFVLILRFSLKLQHVLIPIAISSLHLLSFWSCQNVRLTFVVHCMLMASLAPIYGRHDSNTFVTWVCALETLRGATWPLDVILWPCLQSIINIIVITILRLLESAIPSGATTTHGGSCPVAPNSISPNHPQHIPARSFWAYILLQDPQPLNHNIHSNADGTVTCGYCLKQCMMLFDCLLQAHIQSLCNTGWSLLMAGLCAQLEVVTVCYWDSLLCSHLTTFSISSTSQEQKPFWNLRRGTWHILYLIIKKTSYSVLTLKWIGPVVPELLPWQCYWCSV